MDKIIIDNNQENGDFTKFRQVDIPGVSNIYELFDKAGVDYLGENGPEEIVNFINSHPWVDNIDIETSWIISEARKIFEDKKK